MALHRNSSVKWFLEDISNKLAISESLGKGRAKKFRGNKRCPLLMGVNFAY
jgi:hypothetical protein